MEQARLDCYSFQDQLSMFHLLLCKCFDKLLKQDDKGDVSNRDNRSCPGGYLGWYSDFGRVSCCVTGLSLSPVTVCLACTWYPLAEKLSPLRYRCHKNTFLTRQTVDASS
ncbi:hypothetical protein V6N12_031222 [Hibiscus sabdariffa]|uniref:Uncharacterized protein n=1 Tax=Hibiscus sabdariffa TaxID=183260 RepID=A0ABR2E8D1_9ROSI